MEKKQPVHPLRVGLWALLLGTAVLLAPFRVVEVSGHSMSPTLKNGERYLVDRFYWRLTGLQREDIVVFREGKDELVKRLVGLPADILQLEFTPDGRYIQQVLNLTVNPKQRLPPAENRHDYIVPIGRLFVLGDNYSRSDDSRRFGGVPIENIYGVVRTFDMRRRFPMPPAAPPPPEFAR